MLFALGTLHAAAAVALADDSSKPIQIQADRAELDDRKGTATYFGAVKLTQGTLQVTSDRLVITSNKGEVVLIEAAGLKGPAHYSQQARVDQPPLLANASLITYLTRDKRIKLTGNAHLTQGKNTFSGASIDYDVANQFVAAKGAVGGGGVRVTIDPNKIDQPKPDAGKGDGPKPDSSKPVSSKPDGGKSDGPRTNPARSEAARSDAARSDAAKPDGDKLDVTKSTAGKVDATRADSAKPR